jgi:hypothetical protein
MTTDTTTTLIPDSPDSPNAWDSGRYDWPQPPAQAADVAPPAPAGMPKEVYSRKEAPAMLYRPAIWLLGGIGAVCVLGMIAAQQMGQQVSEGLIAIGSLAVGALANMIAAGNSSGTDSQQV